MSDSDIDLAALDDYLMSERSPEESMLVSDLDGFLTGIIIGPELILPSEWMPVIFRGEEPEFAGKDEASLILGAIMGRYNEIIANLDAGPEHFDPVFEMWDDKPIVTDWAAGFVDAAMLRPKTWEALIRDDEMAAVFYPMLLLGAEVDEDPPFGAPPASAEAMEALYEAAPAIITECIFRIRAFWRGRGPTPSRSSKAASRRRRPDSGRRR